MLSCPFEHLVQCFPACFSPNEPGLLGMEVARAPQLAAGTDLC